MTDTLEALKEKSAELHKELAELEAKAAHKDFPKYIKPHDSHVDRTGHHVSVPAFPEHHIDRAGLLTVLVRDAEEEAKALAEAVK